MQRRIYILGVVLGIAVVAILIANYLVASRIILFDRSEEIANGLSTGGWLVEADSLGVVARGYLILFKDRTLISNNLTYERIVPYDAISDDSIMLSLAALQPQPPYLAYAVKISGMDGQTIVLSAPIPERAESWELYLRKVVEDTSSGNYSRELLGRWRIYGADIFAIDNPRRDGDSGTIEFRSNGDVVRLQDRPPEISHGFKVPDFVRYGVVDANLVLETCAGEVTVVKIHSLGELVVLERGDYPPWILVPIPER